MQKLAVYTLGFLQVPYIRKILRIAGWRVGWGPLLPSPEAVAVWGRKPRSKRGIRAAKRRGLPVLSLEDAFLRSVLPGPKTAPAGLVLDDVGIFFDASQPSKIENIFNFSPLNEESQLERATRGIAFLQHYGLSKYSPVPRGYGDVPKPGYILVIDQTRGDASITCGEAHGHTFATMLAKARADNPEKQIIIRAHPAVGPRAKQGHFTEQDAGPRTTFLTGLVNPWDLLEGAAKVYCVTSQLGFEAILAGHRPVVFGLPFYAGWGLSDDQQKCPRRQRTLSVAQLFAGAMLEYPTWVDLALNTPCSFEDAARELLARARHHWQNSRPTIAVGMRSWKRGQISRFLNRPRFENDPVKAANLAQANQGRVVVWASKNTYALQAACTNHNVPLWQMEDGFLRSKGLGAALTPAECVVLDEYGIYYDRLSASSLEALITRSVTLPDVARARAEALMAQINAAHLSKYNLDLPPPPLSFPAGKEVILVPGQVEDDASIRLGADNINTNLALLKTTRQHNPDAYIIYKPHPDVESGLRKGGNFTPLDYADHVAEHAPILPLIDAASAVWTMTSLTGFEALRRGTPVTCLGMPFYAGWGLTKDLGPRCARRVARPDLVALCHAALIDYPLYLDPKTGQPCAPETLVYRLQNGESQTRRRLRILAKLQGRFAAHAHLWR